MLKLNIWYAPHYWLIFWKNNKDNIMLCSVTNQQHKNTNIDTIEDIFRIFLRSSKEENNLKRELIKLIT